VTPRWDDRPVTRFERKGLAAGRAITDLAYTRRGLGNDHVMRHRAPLLMARVDPKTLRVLRETERVLIPERGAPLGNFGAAQISADEWWVTDSEYIMSTRRDPRGADGSVFAARVWWTKN